MAKVRTINWSIFRKAFIGSLTKLNPVYQVKSPVMFTVEIGATFTTFLGISDLIHANPNFFFTLSISVWLWLTVIFANFAEALAESQGKAKAESLRKVRVETMAKKLSKPDKSGPVEEIPASKLREGDIVLVETGDIIPSDGEVVKGVAMVNESAVTGESAPVIRESGGDRSGVVGGTKVISDWIIVRITKNPGETFLDRMISMVEGAKRGKTPNEIALTILLVMMTIIFLGVIVSLLPFSIFASEIMGRSGFVSITTLVALFVCLIPTTIGGLLPAIGIAGMFRMIKANIIAMSGRAVEAAGDVNVLLLDKTGTITLGNRQAVSFIPANGVKEQELADIAQLASLADETPEGRSIVVLAKKYNIRSRDLEAMGATFVPFTAQTRMSGVDIGSRKIRKGSEDAIREFVESLGGHVPQEIEESAKKIAAEGGTPLLVADNSKVIGIVYLKDIIKGGISERLAELKRMGIKSIMVTGDNPLTAATIAKEAGVDDFIAQAKPEDKLAIIRKYQQEGYLVAMEGDGTNDAPALAQANVAIAMNLGTQAAKEASNMVDLDSNPSKVIDAVRIGKQMLITRGTLTTFSIANDIAKYFAIIPAMFSSIYPQLDVLNIMRLGTPMSAIMSAVIFNALIIPALIPLAIRGVSYKAESAKKLFRNNLLIYGLGGVIAPFIGIKLIDMLIQIL